MATFAKTLQEVRDGILMHVGAEDSMDYQSLVLSFINSAIEDIHMSFDWKHLRGIATVTVTSDTPYIKLNADVRRILSLHKTGQDEYLTEKDAQTFHRLKENDSITTPSFFTYIGVEQSSDTVSPYHIIEVYTAPAEGAEYVLYYIKYLDELGTGDLDVVPLLPPKIWRLVQEKALIQTMYFAEKPRSAIEARERMFLLQLGGAQSEEQLGQSKMDSFQLLPQVAVHLKNRWGR